MVSQFISSHDVNLLGSLDFDFPEGIHAIGRLDNNSEGLLLLTTNKKITKLLFQGPKPHTRTYLVQVKNKMTPTTAASLAGGIPISAPNGSQYLTSPCSVSIVEDATPYTPHPAPRENFLPQTLTIGCHGYFRRHLTSDRY